MEITRTSQYAFDFLNRHRRGAVHSVYKKTINLEMDGQLLAMQVSGSPLSPLSLITDQTAESLDNLVILFWQLPGAGNCWSVPTVFTGINQPLWIYN